jgi:hypothetical protein
MAECGVDLWKINGRGYKKHTLCNLEPFWTISDDVWHKKVHNMDGKLKELLKSFCIWIASQHLLLRPQGQVGIYSINDSVIEPNVPIQGSHWVSRYKQF